MVRAGGATQSYSGAALRVHRDATTLAIPGDPAYGRAMRYQAVPLVALLSELPPDASDTIELRATDGYVVQLPRALTAGRAIPWIAIEDPAHPWPNLPGRESSAGSFYLVWQFPDQSEISPSQWPYALASLALVASPAQRWPAIAVDESFPARAPARRGQAVFAANCMSCHRLAGNGEGTMGPDLLTPMPATAYLTPEGLRALIRDPASVRSWPEQRMPAFDASVIGEDDIDAIIAYLQHLAGRQK